MAALSFLDKSRSVNVGVVGSAKVSQSPKQKRVKNTGYAGGYHQMKNSSYSGFNDSYLNTLQHAGTVYQQRAGMYGQNSNMMSSNMMVMSDQQKKKSRLKSAGAGGRKPMMSGAGTRLLSGATLTR